MATSSSLTKELVFLILQFLDEEKYEETVHKLEKESGVFFNMRYFEDAVTNGEWEEVEKYLLGFTTVEDNRYSLKIFFELRKHKYLEALDNKDRERAVEILGKDLKIFSTYEEKLYKEMATLLTLSDFRENQELSRYGDTKSARARLVVELKKLIEGNPIFRDKLKFPENLMDSRLRTLINQSYVQPNGAQAPSPVTNPLMALLPRVGKYTPIRGPAPFQHAPAIIPSLAGLMAYPSSVPHRAVLLENAGVIPPNNATDAKSRIYNELGESKIWKLSEINEQAQLCSLRLPDSLLPVRIIRLIYTSSGSSILALPYNAVHKLWKWQETESNVSQKASTVVPPQLWQPSSGILMTNDLSVTDLKKAVPCFALSKNDAYVVSASGGKISLYNMLTFKTMTTFMSPPPAATSLAFHPQDNNVIAIGMENSSIKIYDVPQDEVKTSLEGHTMRVTGLAFSSVLNVLVSSSANCQLCAWSLDGWEKEASALLYFPPKTVMKPHWQTRVQFHQDQKQVLVVHEAQIAVYGASTLNLIDRWLTRDQSTRITDATYSCDGQSIFTCFEDGSVSIFTASGLNIKCRISPTAYISSPPTPSSQKSYAMAIASHPSEANQFALGMTDGGVYVLEPLESEGTWGTEPEQENIAGTSKSKSKSGAEDQKQ